MTFNYKILSGLLLSHLLSKLFFIINMMVWYICVLKRIFPLHLLRDTQWPLIENIILTTAHPNIVGNTWNWYDNKIIWCRICPVEYSHFSTGTTIHTMHKHDKISSVWYSWWILHLFKWRHTSGGALDYHHTTSIYHCSLNSMVIGILTPIQKKTIINIPTYVEKGRSEASHIIHK